MHLLIITLYSCSNHIHHVNSVDIILLIYCTCRSIVTTQKAYTALVSTKHKGWLTHTVTD